MNLNKQQQQQWGFLTSMFTALSRVSSNEATAQEMSQPIKDFESSLNNEVKVKMRFDPSPSIEIIDCSKDFIRLNRQDELLELRAKVDGIAFSSRIAYKENYSYSNAAVVDALRALADSIENVPIEMRDQTESVDILIKGGQNAASQASEYDEGEDDETIIELVSVDTQDSVLE